MRTGFVSAGKNRSLSASEITTHYVLLMLHLQDTKLLFNYFDGDNSGSIDFEEFIQGLRVSITICTHCSCFSLYVYAVYALVCAYMLYML